MKEVTEFYFRPAVFDTFGGCAEETDEVLMDYAKLVAARQHRSPKSVFKNVYGRPGCCIWSCNAQAVILRRPNAVESPS